AEIFPMLERIGAEIEKMLGGRSDSRTAGPQGTETAVRPSDRPTVTLADRRAELDQLLREELEHQGIVVRGQDIARAVGASVAKRIEWQGCSGCAAPARCSAPASSWVAALGR